MKQKRIYHTNPRPMHSQPYQFRHQDPVAHCLSAAAQIRSHDLRGDLYRRNSIAAENFRCLDFRNFRARNVAQDLEYNVETWYDKRSRNWITQIKDFGGGQIGDAQFAGDAGGAALNHFSAVANTFLGVAPKPEPSRDTYALSHDEHRTLVMTGMLAEVIYQFLRVVPKPHEYNVWRDSRDCPTHETMPGDEWLAENPDLHRCSECGDKFDSFLGLCACPVSLSDPYSK
jgi:hypothetical protein